MSKVLIIEGENVSVSLRDAGSVTPPDPTTDETPPVVVSVDVDAGLNDAVIGWETSEEASCEATIGVLVFATSGLNHEIKAEMLESDTEYSYSIKATDTAGNKSEYSGTFKTRKPVILPPTGHEHFDREVAKGVHHSASWRGEGDSWKTPYTRVFYAGDKIPVYDAEKEALRVPLDHNSFPQIREYDIPWIGGRVFIQWEMMFDETIFGSEWGHSMKVFRAEDNSEKGANNQQRRVTMNMQTGEPGLLGYAPFYIRDGSTIQQFDVATGKTFDEHEWEARDYYSDSRGAVPSNWGDYPDKQPGGTRGAECSAFRKNEFPHPDGATKYTDLVGNEVFGTYRWQPNVFYRITVELDLTDEKAADEARFNLWAQKLDGNERAYHVISFPMPNAIGKGLGFDAVGAYLHSSKRSRGEWEPVPTGYCYVRNLIVSPNEIAL